VIEFGPGGSGCPEASANAPVAKVNGKKVEEKEPVMPGTNVTFSSHVTQADALKVEWDFGDGIKETVSSDEYQTTTVKHKFEHEGEYTVTETINSGQKETSRPALQTLTTLLLGPGEASVHITSDQTTELDDLRARRLRVGRRLLTRRNAAASGSTRVSAPARPCASDARAAQGFCFRRLRQQPDHCPARVRP
jgi:hypothetical protein